MARLLALAPPREIFLRTGGKVHFLRISTRVQLMAVAALALLLGGWAAATGAMLWSQAHMTVERAAIARQRDAVSSQAARVNAYRRSVDDIARDIEARQDALEEILHANLGTDVAVKPGDKVGKGKAPAHGGTPISDATAPGDHSPEDARLQGLRARQVAFEAQLTQAARTRLARVETAIRSFGLNPAAMNNGRLAQGGPFVPVRGLIASDPELRDIATLLGRLSAMEMTLAAIPSGRPTDAPMETSSFGYRRDPFNGQFAFHAGIDFPGTYGQEILAAASGVVSYVGQRAGYGNVVEIDHGNGIMTRYAHLSRFGARDGEKVARGQAIARMGSTGRSTGTHLHFEVRVRGAAVNPRRFLEARQDVLETQQLAKRHQVASHRG